MKTFKEMGYGGIEEETKIEIKSLWVWINKKGEVVYFTNPFNLSCRPLIEIKGLNLPLTSRELDILSIGILAGMKARNINT